MLLHQEWDERAQVEQIAKDELSKVREGAKDALEHEIRNSRNELTEALNERDGTRDTCKDLVATANRTEDEVLKLRTEVDRLKAQLEALQSKQDKNTDELIFEEEKHVGLFPMVLLILVITWMISFGLRKVTN